MEAKSQHLVFRFSNDVNEIVNTIKELGLVDQSQNKHGLNVNEKQKELRELCSRKFDLILQFLPRRILNSDGPELLGCILKGIPNTTTESTKNKFKIIEKVLDTMRKESTSLSHCAKVVGGIHLELPRLPAKFLVRLCNDSIQSIINDSDVNMIWSHILPESLRSLSSYEVVTHCDTEMSPSEYKEQCVHTLCQCRWGEKQLHHITKLFKNMQLSKNSHKQVVNKICSYIINVSPDNLPPLVHELFSLCKTYHMETVLAHLSSYFSVRLYSTLEPATSDSESTTIEDDNVISHYSEGTVRRCLSTCLYHISQGAADLQMIRKHVKLWPRTQLLRAPFIISIAITLSERSSDFKSVCLDAIRSAIEQRVTDDLKKQESCWVRSVIPTDVDVKTLLKLLVDESVNHRDLAEVGLIGLAFSLLAVSRTKPCAETCWSHGKLILVRLNKAQRETAPYMLSLLADRLLQDSTQKQYTDCLYQLCKHTSWSVEPCTQLNIILENCQPTATDWRSAAAVLDAVHPLFRLNDRLRDVLVMVSRKGFYSRDSIHRCLALSGFLSILRHVRVSPAGWSQSNNQSSAHSYFTQLSADLTSTTQHGSALPYSRVRNEAVCTEVVSILRRCLIQDAAVKRLLYTSIFDCTKDKTALHESIMEILFEHVTKFLPDDEDQTPLKLDKCVQLTGVTAVLIEPIGSLLFAIAQFSLAIIEDLDDILGSQTTGMLLKGKLNQVMEKLCSSEFEIDLEDPGLTDLTPESKAKCLKVQLLLQCYEALIAYRIMQWNIDSSDAARSVYKLFTACNQLIEQTKAPSKLGKKGSKSSNDTRETAKSKSQKSQKEKGKAPVKMSSLVKDRAGPFKPLPCVWDLSFCVRIIELLYSEEILWSSSEQRNQLISRRDFHHWSIRCVQSVLAEPPHKLHISHVLTIATVLYKRSICRFEAMREFDETTALGCLELFKSCISLLLSPYYHLTAGTIMPTLTNQSDTSATICIADVLEHIHTALQKTETEDDEEARDQTDKKIHASLSATAAVMLEIPTEACVEINNVIVKLEEYIRSSKQDISVLLAALLTVSAAKQEDPTLLDQLLVKLAQTLGEIDAEETSSVEESPLFPYIDTATGHAILNLICAHLNARFKCAEHLLHRAKDLTAATAVATRDALRIDKELKELYKSIVAQMCVLTKWTSQCAKLRCSIGAGSDKVLTVCTRLLALLAALAKQMDPPTVLIARFERLLKKSGRKLSNIVNELIMYVERSQPQQTATKVLRDTKLIPRLVLEMENYAKHVMLLATKAKLDWSQYVSLGRARDFKIKRPIVEEMLNLADHDDNIENEESSDINDAVTNIPSAPSDREEENIRSDEENIKRKRKRFS